MRSLRIGIAAIPERQPEAQPLVDIAEPGQAVFAPAVGARARVIVWEVVPGLAVGTVVLADGAPLAFADVGTPEVPVAGLQEAVLEFSERRYPLSLSAHMPDG